MKPSKMICFDELYFCHFCIICIFFPKLRLWVPVLPLGWERPTGYRGPPGDARIMLDANELYDIGTKILFVQCFVATDMFSFSKPIFFSGNCRIFRDLAFGSIKTRFKAILKKLDFSVQIDFSAQIYFFNELLPPGGRLSYEAYNVFTF